ncbi:MAG: serine/threonine-protein kinase [Oscillatoria sp. PMC 1068.18]|nr:serine/threonine-protein kinase [Oscillatoria sp. PMC 1076.18]MEC4987348.1 serine/threonine-protein kinase [Oscillatoria sp. PMC 1068.18]
MPYCLNPLCHQPENRDLIEFCHSCGTSLLLKNRYLALHPFGQGGFGKIFLGTDQHLPSQPYCLIKQLYFQSPDPNIAPKIVQLFQQEALRLDELGKHPQIPTLLAHFEEKGHLYLVQELIEGHNLTEESWQNCPDLEAKIWQLLKDILPVLQYIHDRRVIHRDLKPDNIMRRRQDNKLILIDFGIARLLTNTAIMGGATIVGTAEYMAPEQSRGKVLPASDLYSLGATCLNLLTGVSPLELYDVISEEWTWREHLPAETNLSPKLGEILDKLLQPSLKNRYRSAAEVLNIINSAAFSSLFFSPQTVTNEREASTTSLPEDNEPTLINHNSSSPLTPKKIIPTPTETETPIEIEYSRLRLFLKRKHWRKADEETRAILCQLVGKGSNSYLYNSDIKNLPCGHLQMLDMLWVNYSKGQFGFRIQKQIYEQVKGEYHQFCDLVGWSVHRPHYDYTGFIFSLKAPVGHLPSRAWVGGYNWWEHAEVLAAKLTECQIV